MSVGHFPNPVSGARCRFAPAEPAPARGGETFRLASGLFYEPQPLDAAIADLVAAGFTRGDMCLAGTRRALAMVGGRAALLTPAHAAGRRRLRPLFPLSPDLEVVGTSGILLRKILKEAARHEGDQKLSTAWLLPELFGRFTDQMRRNAIVLLVSATGGDAPRLFSGANRALLEKIRQTRRSDSVDRDRGEIGRHAGRAACSARS
jgi:hypothetical protein